MLIYGPRLDVESLIDRMLEGVQVNGDLMPTPEPPTPEEVEQCSPEEMSEMLDKFLDDLQMKSELQLLNQEEMEELMKELGDLARLLQDFP
ncbi:hypothetical protein [Pseudocowpox virus]|uniref:Uncharacterized protein n=1 Tax=Pseudocowpox virus TaxID=129726 RepID=D3IZF8_9POXV|nr:hypothetical protein PCPV_gp013 [Pseudocowpox virus]ADC53912.1 hypothetical protein [Pseudocowpox virus]